MNKTEKKMSQAAERFAKRWEGKGYEKGESQLFWTELLTEVFGIEEPSSFISFEDKVHLDHTSFIDGYIDRAVMAAYGFPTTMTESEIVAKLFTLYTQLTQQR